MIGLLIAFGILAILLLSRVFYRLYLRFRSVKRGVKALKEKIK